MFLNQQENRNLLKNQSYSQTNTQKQFNPKYQYSSFKKKKERQSSNPPLIQEKDLHFLVNKQQEYNKYPLNNFCKIHNQQIVNLCFSCKSKCLCAICLYQQNHKTHDIKNIDKSNLVVQTNLNEYLIRLRSKCDLLSILCGKIKNLQAEIFQNCDLYKQQVETNFNNTIKILLNKKQQIFQNISQFCKEAINHNSLIITEISNNIKKTMLLYTVIEDNINQLPNITLCCWYADKKKDIQKLMSQNIIEQYKENIFEFKFNLNLIKFQKLNKQIEIIKQFHSNTFNKITNKMLKTKINKQKSQRTCKPRVSHPILSTNQKIFESVNDKSKILTKRLIKIINQQKINKSKNSGKITSMPSSPIKQGNFQKKISIELFKTLKSKKKL